MIQLSFSEIAYFPKAGQIVRLFLHLGLAEF